MQDKGGHKNINVRKFVYSPKKRDIEDLVNLGMAETQVGQKEAEVWDRAEVQRNLVKEMGTLSFSDSSQSKHSQYPIKLCDYLWLLLGDLSKFQL